MNGVEGATQNAYMCDVKALLVLIKTKDEVQEETKYSKCKDSEENWGGRQVANGAFSK
jgi:hypothetical protein